MKLKYTTVTLTLLGSFAAFGPLYADQAAIDILRKASHLPAEPYQGKISSRIQHGPKVQDVKAVIKMESPDRYKKEFYGTDDKLDRISYTNDGEEWIYFPDRNVVWKGDKKKTQAKRVSEDREWELIAQNYNVDLKPVEKVAGRNALVLEVTPKAKGKPYRTVWVDRNHYLILKNKEFHPDGSLAVESVFEEVQFPQKLADGAMELNISTSAKIKEHNFNPNFLSMEELKKSGAEGLRVPDHLPEGFVFESADLFSVKGKEVSHLRFTDGLNVISLFQSSHPISTKRAQHLSWKREERPGSSSSLGFSTSGKVLYWQSGDQYFTLVGNLSSEALDNIAASLK